jgi:hypothetical protein
MNTRIIKNQKADASRQVLVNQLVMKNDMI